MMDINAIVQTITILALPLVFAITLHEAAHGYVARYFGDSTAWQAGRISLNPLRHIGNFLFGYAKPVPVDFSRLRNPKKDMFWVAAAGPGANLLMACAWALAFKLSWLMPQFFSTPLARMAEMGIQINCVLMVLNLFPLPPLDGGRIAVSLLPHSVAWKFAQLERWGFPILLVLLFTGVLGAVMTPLVNLSTWAIELIFGLY